MAPLVRMKTLQQAIALICYDGFFDDKLSYLTLQEHFAVLCSLPQRTTVQKDEVTLTRWKRGLSPLGIERNAGDFSETAMEFNIICDPFCLGVHYPSWI